MWTVEKNIIWLHCFGFMVQNFTELWFTPIVFQFPAAGQSSNPRVSTWKFSWQRLNWNYNSEHALIAKVRVSSKRDPRYWLKSKPWNSSAVIWQQFSFLFDLSTFICICLFIKMNRNVFFSHIKLLTGMRRISIIRFPDLHWLHQKPRNIDHHCHRGLIILRWQPIGSEIVQPPCQLPSHD